jgi:DNA/RNA-binding domain of Phe-tRNA-synthetase-like protein
MLPIRIAGEVMETFPETNVHFLACKCAALIPPTDMQRWKESAAKQVELCNFDREHLAEYPEFKEWRDTYAKFGLKPSRFRSSVEQLWRRALQGNLLETSVPLVNLYCYISIIARIPMGAYDLGGGVTGAITLRKARPGEHFMGIGEQEAVSVHPGVIVYADEHNVLTFGWNHRDALHSCLKEETKTAIFFADSSLNNSRYRAEHGMLLLQQALTETGNKIIATGVLDQQQTEITIDLKQP